MTRYRAMRNPDGVRVSQTWYAKSLKSNDADIIKITAVFSENLILIETNNGRQLQTNDMYLKEMYSLERHDDLFGES